MDYALDGKSFKQVIQSPPSTNLEVINGVVPSTVIDPVTGSRPVAKTSGMMRKSPWYLNDGNFKADIFILKSDLILPNPKANLVDGFLCLEETIIPHRDWVGFLSYWFFCR